VSRKRTVDHRPDIDRALRSLFKGVEVRVVPDRLRDIVEQLEAQSAAKASA
jgi:hypothetical protein